MSIRVHESFYSLKARGPDGKLLDRRGLQREFQKGKFILSRWCPNVTKAFDFSLKVQGSGRQWSGAFYPSTRTIYLSSDWIWPWTSVPRVLAHEIFHSLGVTGHKPNNEGRSDFIMTVGANGFWGECHPSEVQWLCRRYGLPGPHAYHPLVRAYALDAKKNLRKFKNLGLRLAEMRDEVQRLRELRKAQGLTTQEASLLATTLKRIDNFKTSRKALFDDFKGWKRTADLEILGIARAYGDFHVALLPEQKIAERERKQMAAPYTLPNAFRNYTIESVMPSIPTDSIAHHRTTCTENFAQDDWELA